MRAAAAQEFLARDPAEFWGVVAAHPDDESVSASWFMAQAPQLCVVHTTDGVPRDPRLRARNFRGSGEAYGALRQRELRAALAELGRPLACVHGLGFSDQRLCEQLAPAARALAEWLVTWGPARLVTHAYEGGHPDHDATCLVMRAALALARPRLTRLPKLYEMASYHGMGGTLQTLRFVPHGAREWVIALSPEEQARKRRMLWAHASQREVLAVFAVEEERYREAAPTAFSAPPHAGPLFYEQQGWGLGERFRELVRTACGALGLSLDELGEPSR